MWYCWKCGSIITNPDDDNEHEEWHETIPEEVWEDDEDDEKEI